VKRMMLISTLRLQ